MIFSRVLAESIDSILQIGHGRRFIPGRCRHRCRHGGQAVLHLVFAKDGSQDFLPIVCRISHIIWLMKHPILG